MEILLYITDCGDRVLAGSSLALKLPNDSAREKFLEVLSETLEGNVLQMENGDHILVRKN